MENVNFTEMPLNNIKPFIIANVNSQIESQSCARISIFGTPGCGKSDIIRNICKEQNWALSVKYLSNMSMEQITGIPCKVCQGDIAVFSKPEIFNFSNLEFIPDNYTENTPTILLLDDFHLADKIMQKYLFQLLTYKSINNYQLPKNVAIVLAGNRITDKALAHSIPAPIMNRLLVFEVKADANDWILNFAIDNNIRGEIISFISKYPHLLSSVPIESKPWASPRSWTFLSDQMNVFERINQNLDVVNLNMIASGLLGTEVASEFISYHEIFSKWNIDKLAEMNVNEMERLFLKEIIDNPINAYAITYSTMAWMIEKTKKDDFDVNKNPEIKNIVFKAYQIMTALLAINLKHNYKFNVNVKPLIVAGTNFMFTYDNVLQKNKNINLYKNFSNLRSMYLENLTAQRDIDWIYYDTISTIFNIKLDSNDLEKIQEAYANFSAKDKK